MDIEGTELDAFESGFPGWNNNRLPRKTIFECGAKKTRLNGRSTSTWESIAKFGNCHFNLLYDRISARFVLSNRIAAHFVLDGCGGADIEMICEPDVMTWTIFTFFVVLWTYLFGVWFIKRQFTEYKTHPE